MKRLRSVETTQEQLMRLPAGTKVRDRGQPYLSGNDHDEIADGPFFVYTLKGGGYVAVGKVEVYEMVEVHTSAETLAQYGPVEIPAEWGFDRCAGIMVGRCVKRDEEEGGGVSGWHVHLRAGDPHRGWMCVQSPKRVWGQTRQPDGSFVRSGKPTRKLAEWYAWMSERLPKKWRPPVEVEP